MKLLVRACQRTLVALPICPARQCRDNMHIYDIGCIAHLYSSQFHELAGMPHFHRMSRGHESELSWCDLLKPKSPPRLRWVDMPCFTLQGTGARDLCPVSLIPDRYPQGTGTPCGAQAIGNGYSIVKTPTFTYDAEQYHIQPRVHHEEVLIT